MSFKNLGLSNEILKAVDQKGYKTPSPIQEKAIPAIISGNDVMAAAQTGTGKTAGFTLPVIQNLSQKPKAKPLQVRCLILTPTRELAAQVYDNAVGYSQFVNLKSAVVFGGVNIKPQIRKLKSGCDILVATPGRLLDLYQQKALKLDRLEILVLDEADRMLDMGFIHDIKKLLKIMPSKRQNLMFSATFSNEIRKLANKIFSDPIEISIAPKQTTAAKVEHFLYHVEKKQKTEILIRLIKESNWEQVLVFSRTKHGANKITKLLLANDISAAAIHGNKSQGARTKALADFKDGKIQALIATDIAARGIDIDQLPQVVNYDLPEVPEDYVHRIGRTGRAGASGAAISLVSIDEFPLLNAIERVLKQLIDRKLIEGYKADGSLPESSLTGRPPQKVKPKTKPQRPNFKKKTNTKSKFKKRKASDGTKGNSKPSTPKKRPRPSSRRTKPSE